MSEWAMVEAWHTILAELQAWKLSWKASIHNMGHIGYHM